MKCPGHFGHVELVAPVYNPLVFEQLSRFTRSKCLCCHRFKLKQARVERFVDQLRCLSHGDLLKAKRIRGTDHLKKVGLMDDDTPNNNNSDDHDDDSGDNSADDTRSGGGGSSLSDGASSQHQRHESKTIHATEAWRDLVNDFWKAIPASRCENCGALQQNRDGAHSSAAVDVSRGGRGVAYNSTVVGVTRLS